MEPKTPEKSEVTPPATPALTADDTTPLDVAAELAANNKSIEANKDKIDTAYNDAAKIRITDATRLNDSVVASVLKMPLRKIAKEMEENVVQYKGEKLTNKRREKYLEAKAELHQRIEQTVNFATSYIIRMAKDHGGLDNEALAKMSKDVNRKASNFIDLLLSGNHPKLVQAFLYAVGSSGDSGDMKVAREGDIDSKGAIDIMIQYLDAHFGKKNSHVMPYIWSVLAFMSSTDRCKIAQEFCGNDPQDLKIFLEEGNKKGVYTWEDIETVNKDLKVPMEYTPADIAKFQENWRKMNDFRAEAERQGFIPSGTINAAVAALTLTSVGLGFFQAGAIFTIFANFITGAWQGGTFQGVKKSIARITNVQSGLAVAGLIGAELLKNNKTVADFLNGDQPKVRAARDLHVAKNGRPEYPAWKTFVGKKDTAYALNQFVQYARKNSQPPENDLDKLTHYITPANFESYLDRMIKETEAGAADGKGIDYALVKDAFKELNPTEIFTFAKIFDTLNISGANAQANLALWADSPEKMLEQEKAPKTAQTPAKDTPAAAAKTTT